MFFFFKFSKPNKKKKKELANATKDLFFNTQNSSYLERKKSRSL